MSIQSVLSKQPALECILGHLGQQDLKGLNSLGGVNRALNKSVNTQYAKIAPMLGISAEQVAGLRGRVYNEVSSLYEYVRKLPKSLISEDIQKIIKGPVSLNGYKKIQEFLEILKVRSTLVVWKKIANEIDVPFNFNIPENISDILQNPFLYKEEAAKFSNWLNEHSEQIRNVLLLDLDLLQLTHLPAEIGQLTNLRELLVSDNQLKTLPPKIGQLTNLRRLVVSDNQLRALPEEIGQLTNLRELWVYNNQLTTLPEEIGQLTNLEWLYVSNNQLTTLPEEIGQLTNLEWLNVSNNQLKALPAEIRQLRNLEISGAPFNWEEMTKSIAVSAAVCLIASWYFNLD